MFTRKNLFILVGSFLFFLCTIHAGILSCLKNRELIYDRLGDEVWYNYTFNPGFTSVYLYLNLPVYYWFLIVTLSFVGTVVIDREISRRSYYRV